MTEARAKHFRQLGAFYAIVFATGFLWRVPHSTVGWILVLLIVFGAAPWLVLSQPDQ